MRAQSGRDAFVLANAPVAADGPLRGPPLNRSVRQGEIIKMP